MDSGSNPVPGYYGHPGETVGSVKCTKIVSIWLTVNFKTGAMLLGVSYKMKRFNEMRTEANKTRKSRSSIQHEQHIVARVWRLYKTGIALTTGFFGSHTVTHNYSVYTLHSQFTIVLAEPSYCVFTGCPSFNTVGPFHLQNRLPLLH
jgi:hypothetical protein